MICRKVIIILAMIVFASAASYGQKSEIVITLDEQFFSNLIDAAFQSGTAPEFSIASGAADTACPEKVQLLRQGGAGVRTSVRLRDGQITAPLAFAGKYNPPFVGCVDFAGVADTAIVLEFDSAGRRLVARATVVNVSLNGTNGVGGTAIARLLQSSIDRRVNPIEVIKLDRLSFPIQLKNSALIKFDVTGIRYDLGDGIINFRIAYAFSKV